MDTNAIRERAALNESFWKRQLFKLIYILCIMFVLPALLIGFFVVYLAIYEPAELRKRMQRPPQVAVDPLENPSFFVRQAAMQKLVNGPADRGRRDIAEKLKKNLRDGNFQNQELAIAALGKWGQPADAAALRELAADRFSVFVRPQICKALGELGGAESIEALIDIVGMGGAEQEHAISALALHREQAEDALLARAEAAQPAMLAPICVALARLGSQKSLPILEAAKQNADPQVSAEATKAAAAIQAQPH